MRPEPVVVASSWLNSTRFDGYLGAAEGRHAMWLAILRLNLDSHLGAAGIRGRRNAIHRRDHLYLPLQPRANLKRLADQERRLEAAVALLDPNFRRFPSITSISEGVSRGV